MSTFKIETIKWSWADAVESKEVYRNDEFVRTKTKEEALAAIDFLMSQEPIREYLYTITVFRDDYYFTYWRHSMPCLGGLVKYRASHGERYSMNAYFPRDIYVSFPEGDIIFIACYRRGIKSVLSSPYYELILSDQSPWVSAFGSKDTIIFRDNHFILTNMDADPTALYSLMKLGCLAGFPYEQQKNHPKALLLVYTMNSADPRRLAGQKPIRISGGTWAEGYGYTRPFNESVFKTSLPEKYANFSKLVKGYPKAPFTNTYFVGEMKRNFGIDASKLNTLSLKDAGIEMALVKAWDYFKGNAGELEDRAD